MNLNNEINKTLLHLTLIEKLGPATIEKLISKISQSFQSDQKSSSFCQTGYKKLDHELLANINDLYQYKTNDFIKIFKLSEAASSNIVNGLADKSILNKELELLSKHRIDWISIYDDEYPLPLQYSHLPPIGLYIQGSSKAFSGKMISVVGSRNADKYGYNAVQKFVPYLVGNGYTIVSGGALGIDSLAHAASLQAKGLTISVLGTGLLQPYPPSNRWLFQSIIEAGGAIISPFGLNVQALPGNFPARNRIIAALSCATIVVQAAEKSGALITASFAVNYGREVIAIPGSIDNPLSEGCHKLISQGAAIATKPEDITSILSMQNSAHFRSPVNKPDIINTEKNNQVFFNDLDSLPSHKKLTYFAATPISFEELIIKMGLESSQLQELLLESQLDGKIDQNHMGLWYTV